MLAKENVSAQGRVHFVLTDANGNVKQHEVKNLVVATGLNYIVSRMKDATVDVMSHMAVGSGTTAADAGDTGVQTQLARVALSSTVVSENQIVYSATFSPGIATGAITEAGLFNAATGGTMLCRTVFPVVNKQTADTLTVTWTVTIS